MTSMPPPCQRCGRARLSTGLCPHCEHVMCPYCYLLMSIIEYGDHRRANHKGIEAVPGGPTYLFWWEIKTDWPKRCPGCDAILNLDGSCPNDVGPRPNAHFNATAFGARWSEPGEEE